ncbi:MAG: ABC transporter substrate-binding protein [Balneolaceae bacterium]|nr:ABC transporter substrate-binding protein [Balneolaceae bacterium]MBO6545235.1 ABC transporter substrate-binding protein [Balneolaceae bacterium]MBO6646631.1 ABC transporter substrate-binding protein [Balneolaceae bacterium]
MSYKRIISLVPSLTELLIDLGLKDQLIGRTKFCIHPEQRVQLITSVGGTKNPHIQKILSLNPDLIITNKEENRKEDVQELAKHTEVIVTEIDTIDEAIEWILKLGTKVGKITESEGMVSEIIKLSANIPTLNPIQTAYFIWKDPWMTVGNDTYIHDVMSRYGLVNVFSNQSRYPVTTLGELSSLSPDLVLLSSEPYPFKEKHIYELKEVCPDSNIELVNEEWFSWYGSRMVPAFEALNSWRTQLSLK